MPRKFKRRHVLKSAIGAAAWAVCPRVSCGASRCGKPNIVFILIDDMGWKDVGFMGSRYYETPHIDQLAREGIVFTDAYANAPNCAPTRACLLSGQYSPRHGIYTVGKSTRGKPKDRKLIPTKNTTVLSPDIDTIAEALKQAGYTNAHAGKWHLGTDPEAGPLAQGFHVNIGGNQAGHPARYFSPYKNPNLPDGPEGEYLTDRLTDDALRFIESNRKRPFFLYFAHYAVHTPIQAKQDLIDKYKTKAPDNGQKNPTYAAMVDSVDQSVGRVMDKLDELGLTDNTIVVFFSDNGGHGLVTSMKPLRGSKGMLYEGGIREPAIVRWPGHVKPGRVCHDPIIGLDFYPTLLEIAGIKSKPDRPMDGESLVPLLTGKGALTRDAIFWHFPAYLQANRNMKSKWRTTPAGAIRQGDYKLIEFFEDGKLELYNLKTDIGETNNLAEKMPGKTKSLHQRLIEWRKSVNAPVPTEPNPEYNPS